MIDHNRRRIFPHIPLEQQQVAAGAVGGNAGVDHRLAERLRQEIGKGLLVIDAVAEGPGVADRHDGVVRRRAAGLGVTKTAVIGVDRA